MIDTNSLIFVFFLALWALEEQLFLSIYMSDIWQYGHTETRYYDEPEVTSEEIKRKYAGTNYGPYNGTPMTHESVYPNHNSWGIFCVSERVVLSCDNQSGQQGV